MKIRNDFVTNSSSSSYVIALKREKIEASVMKIIDAILQCRGCIDTYPAERVYSPTDVFDEDCPYNDKLTGLIKDGYEVYSKSIDNDDLSLCDILDCLKDFDGVRIDEF